MHSSRPNAVAVFENHAHTPASEISHSLLGLCMLNLHERSAFGGQIH